MSVELVVSTTSLVSGDAVVAVRDGNPANIVLGTAAELDVGTGADQIVQLNGSAQLPAVDGSLLTGIDVGGTITAVLAGTGLAGGASSGDATLALSSGSQASLALADTSFQAGTISTLGAIMIKGAGNTIDESATAPVDLDDYVTLTGREVLTNKTLTSPTLTTPVLGTPSSGTLTSCTGLPASGLVATTSLAVGFGSIELSHATQNTLTGSGGRLLVEGVNVVTISSTDTLTNKTLTSPTLTTPVLGTPSSGTLTSCTGLPGSALVTGTLAAGFPDTEVADGTKSSGTYTPAVATGYVHTATNGGAHTLAPPSATCSMLVCYTNNGSAGTITTSGWTKVDGDAFTTTNGHKFHCYMTVTSIGSHLTVKALQ
jgi:hypothetical protein